MSAQVTVKGSLTQTKGLTTLSISIVHKITGVLGGKPGKTTVSEQIKAEIDEELLQMRGTVSAFGETEFFEEDLPEGMDGSCTLEINPTNGRKGIAGSAALTLSNLEIVNFDIKGSNKNGAVKLTLKGSKLTGDAGASISLGIEALSGMIRTLQGKVLGQGVSGGSVAPDSPFEWSDLTGFGDGDSSATPR